MNLFKGVFKVDRHQSTAWLGIGASAIFFTALAVWGAADPAYSHSTKAVSELGAVGAANQLTWNLTGFLAVGIMLAIFGWRYGKLLDDRLTGWLLALFGWAFAASAIPVDMDDLRSSSSIAHIVAAMAVFLFWALALIRILFIKRRLPGLKPATAAALALALGSIVLRASELLLPGLAQRVSFLVVFGWVVVAAVLLMRGRKHDL
jgi:hypothetical protein